MLFSHFTVLHGRITLSTHCTEVKSSPVWAPHQGKSTKAMGLPQQRPALGEQLCPTGGQCQAPSWPRGHRVTTEPPSPPPHAPQPHRAHQTPSATREVSPAFRHWQGCSEHSGLTNATYLKDWCFRKVNKWKRFWELGGSEILIELY